MFPGKKFETQSGRGTTQCDAGPSQPDEPSQSQFGAGGFEISDGLIEAITSKLIQKHPSFRPVNPNWQYSEAAQPIQSSEVIPENTLPSASFSVNLFQNDHNDSFDCKVLLKKVPRLYKQKATTLLNIFEKQPNDLTFDSKGTVFIDSEAIPNSNINQVFPALFKKRSASIDGLSEVVVKLNQMNLSHLIAHTNIVKPKLGMQGQGQKLNWWYLK